MMITDKRPYLVGIAGGPASGKNLVCEKIIKALGHGTDSVNKQVNRISLESFYRELTPEEQKLAAQGKFDFDHPSAFEFKKLIELIQALQRGEAVDVPQYDFVANKKSGTRRLEHTDVLLVEGILVFYNKALREMFHMKLFVDADPDIRLGRRVEHDVLERNRNLQSVLDNYMNKVKPAFEEFCLPTKKYSDIIVPRGGENNIAIDCLVQKIDEIVNSPRGNSRQNGSVRSSLSSDSCDSDVGFASSAHSSRRGRASELTARPH